MRLSASKQLILGSIVLLGIACQKIDKQDNTRITFPQGNTLTVSCDTVRCSVAYQLYDGTASSSLTDISGLKVESNAGWAVVDSVACDSIFLCIHANYEASSRVAKLGFCYKNSPVTYLTISQKSNPDYRLNDNLDFQFNVTEASAWRIVCDIEPNYPDSYYRTDIMSKQQYDSYQDTKAFLDAQFLQMTQYRVTYLFTYGYDLPYTFFINKGTQTLTKTELEPLTEYVVFAYAMTPAPSFGKTVFTKVVKSDAVPQSDPTFDISENNGTISITPDNDARTYLYLICDDKVWKQYSSPQALAQDYIDELGSEVGLYSRKGAIKLDYSSNLTEGTKYWVVAFGHLGKKINTGISYYSFSFEK